MAKKEQKAAKPAKAVAKEEKVVKVERAPAEPKDHKAHKAAAEEGKPAVAPTAPDAPATTAPATTALIPAGKLKFAIYWGNACGGCDVSLVDLDAKILDVVAIADIILWPVAMDFKYHDVEAMADGSIAVTLFNGGVKNSETEHIARMLRKKSGIVVAYGACACFGGIPGLANITDRDGVFDKAYRTTFSTVNPEGVIPQTEWKVPEGTLTLPEIYDHVRPLNQVIDVDYYLPGCPPVQERILDLVGAVVAFVKEGKPLPPKGTVIAHEKSLCEECPRERKDKRIPRIVRIHELKDDYKTCLLEQGVICLGISTRAGCNARCINVNMPCRGCFGPTPGVIDQGASTLSAIASNLDLGPDELKNTEADIERLMAQVRDPLGYFYRYTLASSLLKYARKEERPKEQGGESR